MAYGHGKRTRITVNGGNLSPWCKNSELTRGGDKHDVTGYGADDHEFGDDGLGTGEFVCDGTYESTVTTGSRAILKPVVKTLAAVVRQPEGLGVGKPTETFTAFCDEYKESSPVADYIKWSAKFTVSGPIVDTVQV